MHQQGCCCMIGGDHYNCCIFLGCPWALELQKLDRQVPQLAPRYSAPEVFSLSGGEEIKSGLLWGWLTTINQSFIFFFPTTCPPVCFLLHLLLSSFPSLFCCFHCLAFISLHGCTGPVLLGLSMSTELCCGMLMSSNEGETVS